MKRFPLIMILVVAAALLLVAGVAVAATMGDDGDESLTGPDADRAAAAALESVSGEVSSVEASDDDGSAYEVEVITSEGTVEVQVDEGFNVVSLENENGDDDSEDEAEDDAEDGSGSEDD